MLFSLRKVNYFRKIICVIFFTKKITVFNATWLITNKTIDHLPERLLVYIFNPLIQKVSDVRQPTKKAYRLTSDRPLVSSGVQLCSSECLQVRQVCSISAGTAFSCLNFRLFRIISSNVTGSKPFMSVPAFSICSLPASSGQ